MPPKQSMEGNISRNRLAQAKEAFQRAEEERKRRESSEMSDNMKKHLAPKSFEGIPPNKAGSSSSTTRKKRWKPFKLPSFNANNSMSSISELEPVLVFDQSQCSNMSSLSQLTISNGSLQLSFSNCVTQGPSLFDLDGQEKVHTAAPKLPLRRRGTSLSELEFEGERSDSSLSLEDIIEETTNHSTSSNTTATTEATTVDTGGRQWSEPSTSDRKGVSMPIRSDSIKDTYGPKINSLQSSFCSDTSWLSESSFAEEESYDSSHLSISTTSFEEESASVSLDEE